jgi:hypothetical protein
MSKKRRYEKDLVLKVTKSNLKLKLIRLPTNVSLGQLKILEEIREILRGIYL